MSNGTPESFVKSIDLTQIGANAPQSLKNICTKLHQHGYYTVGRLLRELSDIDLWELQEFCNKVLNGSLGRELHAIVLLGEIFAQAEGISINEPDIARTRNTMALINLEVAARNGALMFYRERATVSPDVDLNTLFRA